jgi:L-arabonate dehydrase
MNKLRSQAWFGRKGRDGFLYRSWMKNQGWPTIFSMAAR